MINTNRISFVTSGAAADGFVSSALPRIVFTGRSNVGKSSVINSLACRRNLARIGNTPGKTLHVNYFDADGKLLWVDLPGYGYAKVSFTEKLRWADLIEEYFEYDSKSIALGILIVDLRHDPTDQDKMMYNYFTDRSIDCVVVANKCDKLKASEIQAKLSSVKNILGMKENEPIIFSAVNNTGRDELFGKICSYEVL